MKRFQLRYELPRGDAFIAPQLLSSDQPTYELEEQGSLVLRYRYEFMPKGMITRLIVTLHHLIADPRLVWKSGVVLEQQETRAEVIEDYPHRTIRVWVAGRDPRGLLAIVDDQLGLMHHSLSIVYWLNLWQSHLRIVFLTDMKWPPPCGVLYYR